jgi:hypothetical protein
LSFKLRAKVVEFACAHEQFEFDVAHIAPKKWLAGPVTVWLGCFLIAYNSNHVLLLMIKIHQVR